MSAEWRPVGAGSSRSRRAEVGDVVAYDRRAWKVRNVDLAEPEAQEADRLASYTAPFRDRMLPYRVVLHRIHGAKHERENSSGDIALRVPLGAYNPLPIYSNGRVPLCSCHSEPWPCIEADQQTQAAKEMQHAEREMRLLPGFCPECQEPVTPRQRSIRFPGPYVRNPFLVDPVFHLRRKCYSGASHYEDAWVAADPTRSRSLLTLSCAGTVVVHYDGSAECFGAEGSDCPSIYARHRCAMACYVQSHGCGQGCSTRGHPGTRIAGRPDDPRALTGATS